MNLITVDAFKNKSISGVFGDYVVCTGELLPEIRLEAMQLLAEAIVTGADICGYKCLKPQWIEHIPDISSGTVDTLDQNTSMAGKIITKLTATNEQYNHYLFVFAKSALDSYLAEVEKREKQETWFGFLGMKIRKLRERFSRGE